MIVICYFKQKTAYEERIRDWSSDVCSSDRDAGDDAALGQDVDQRGAVLGLLAQRLVVEDDAGDILFGAGGGEQHLAIVAAVLLGRRHVDAGQALFDGRGAFVGGQAALARRDHRPGARVEFGEVHVVRSPPTPSIFGGWPGILDHPDTVTRDIYAA